MTATTSGTSAAEVGSDRDAARAAPRGGARFAAFLRRRPELAIIWAAVLVRLPLVFHGITYRLDIWRQSDEASIARNFVHDANLFFPRINWGGSGPGFVESELQIFPWLVSRLYRVFGEHVWFGRGLAVAFSGVTLWLFWLLAVRVMSRRAALVALTFFAACPLFLRYSVAFMPEAPALMLYVGALLFFDRWLDDHRWRTALTCGAFAGAAALVKPTTLSLGIVFAIMLLARRGRRGLLDRQAVTIAAITLVPCAVWMWHAVQLHHEFGNTFGVISGGDRKFGNIGYWTSPSFYAGTLKIDLLLVFAIFAVVPAVIGVVLAIRDRAPVILLAGLVAMALYYLAVARYIEDDRGIQYHLTTVVYAAIAVGLGGEWLLSRATVQHGRARTVTMLVAAFLAIGFAVSATGAYADHYRSWGTEAVACGDAIRAVVPAGDLIVVGANDPSHDDQGMPDNFQNPTLFYFGDRKGWSLAADQQEPARIDSLVDAGARWFVIDDRRRLDDNAPLASYLVAARQLGPGFAAGSSVGCAIYRLPPG